MYILKVNKTEYKSIERWDEMKLQVGIDLAILCYKDMPVRMKDYWDTMSTLDGTERDEETKKKMLEFETSITEEERFKTFPEFYGKVLKLLSDIPQEVINFIDPISRMQFFHEYLKQFCWGVLYCPYDLKSEPIQYFDVEGIRYFIPEDSNILGTVRPMGKGTTAIEFAESADLLSFSSELSGGNVAAMANVISILCRPINDKGDIEKYDEKKSLEAAEIFKKYLNMKTVWEVFFCLREQLLLLHQYTTISFLQDQVEKQRQPMKVQD